MSDLTPTNHKEIIQLIKRISGQANFIGTPRLFIDLFDGDIVAAVWFNQVVFWDGKNTNPIGFYKTADDWKSEIGLSKFQVRRAARVCEERGLISTDFKKAYGTPKIHYLVIWPELLRVLNELLQKSDLAQSETSKVNKSDLAQSETSEGKESKTSKDITQTETSLINHKITSENQEEEEEEIILPQIDKAPRDLLGKLDILFPSKTFGKLSIRKNYLEQSGAFVLGWVAKAHLDRERLNSPIAFIASRLNGTTPPDVYYLESFREILPDEYLEALELASYSCPNCFQVFQKRKALESHWMASHDEQEEPEETIVAPEIVDPEAGKTWETVRDQLSLDMPRASFSSWVAPTLGITIEDGILRVWAPTSYAREWLSSRIASTVDRFLLGLNSRAITVEFFTGSGNGSTG